MRYWWASHGRNYEKAIDDGTLWGARKANGEVSKSLLSLREMRHGDVVFHYFGPYVRAVSVVAEECRDFPRPDGYERLEGEDDDGWLVRVNTLATGLQIHRDRAAELTSLGGPGPFTEAGKPEQRYLSPLTDDEGAALLALAGVNELQATVGSLRGLPGDVWGAGEPDTQALSTIRLEQEHLRKNLLRGRQSASCSICGAELPERLLIAGHIKPRARSTPEERMDFEANAMLTCALGCDALYEWGYVVVDGDGTIQAGHDAETPRIQETVESLLGRHCSAHNEHTAANFAENTTVMLG